MYFFLTRSRRKPRKVSARSSTTSLRYLSGEFVDSSAPARLMMLSARSDLNPKAKHARLYLLRRHSLDPKGRNCTFRQEKMARQLLWPWMQQCRAQPQHHRHATSFARWRGPGPSLDVHRISRRRSRSLRDLGSCSGIRGEECSQALAVPTQGEESGKDLTFSQRRRPAKSANGPIIGNDVNVELGLETTLQLRAQLAAKRSRLFPNQSRRKVERLECDR